MSERKKTAIISLVAETHIHVGVGQSTGALDLPVARERTTQFPFVPGSGVKGAFRVWSEEIAGLGSEISKLFGPKDEDVGGDLYAGSLLCSDARLLLLPVRSISDAYKWVTCPTILNRFQRDCQRAGIPCDFPTAVIDEGTYVAADTNDEWLGLEEREFKYASPVNQAIVAAFEKAVGGDLKPFMRKRLVILSDDDFFWFARYALPVMTRNVLNENKISQNLWHEESLAPDTIMYVLLGERRMGAVEQITHAFRDPAYIQMGGNETVGQGWFRMIELGRPDAGGRP